MPTRLTLGISIVLAFAVGLSSSHAQSGGFRMVTDAMSQDPDPADWLNWRRTLDG